MGKEVRRKNDVWILFLFYMGSFLSSILGVSLHELYEPRPKREAQQSNKPNFQEVQTGNHQGSGFYSILMETKIHTHI